MVRIKDVLKLASVMILTCAAVAICTIFINFSFDLQAIGHLITDTQSQILYDAQLSMSKIIVACAGGVMGAVTLIVLLFSIGKYITNNSANMGVLKALGYSKYRLALSYAMFGINILIGTLLGYLIGFLVSPLFYKALIGDMVAKFTFGFHIETILIVIVAPTIIFTILAQIFAIIKLRRTPLEMINGSKTVKINKLTQKKQAKNSDKTFLKEMKVSMLCNNILQMFFVWFAGFGFSAQIEMSFSMRKLTSNYTMTITLIIFGIILGLVTLLLAFSHLFNANKKHLSILIAYGYTESECNSAIFGGYRIAAYIGFAVGSGYQFMLVKMIVSIFASSYEMPKITFNFVGLVITLVIFVLFYELLMVIYKKRIASVPLRQIMNS